MSDDDRPEAQICQAANRDDFADVLKARRCICVLSSFK